MKTWSDQEIAEEIRNKENELFILQECKNIVESLKERYKPIHISVLFKSLECYETVLANDVQLLEDLIKGSIYINRSYKE